MADTEKSQLFQNIPEFSVAELANSIKRTLEQSYSFVRLRGEISGYRGPHSSGHCYFSIKDDKAKVDAVIWRGVFSKLKFKPEEGLEVVVTGKVSSYPGSSKYQIVIEALEPAGAGALMMLLEERKKKLAAEGLFDEARKKPLPFLPNVIGIVTSPTGAVIRDMMHGFTERFPSHVVVWPVRVQGDTSSVEVANAIHGFNALQNDESNSVAPRPDVIIVARGGGSLEDLWGFNEENVARAVAASEIPVISAVGHETDWTIIDLVADARAPTPTKAAEWAVPKYSDLVDRLSELELRLNRTVQRVLESAQNRLAGLARGLPKPIDLIALPRQRLDFAASKLSPSLQMLAKTARSKWSEVSARMLPGLRSGLHARKTEFIVISGRFTPVLRQSLQVKVLDFQRVAAGFDVRNLRTQIAQGQDRLSILHQRQQQAFSYRLSYFQGKLEGYEKLLNSLSYQNVLQRGFALVRDEKGRMIRQVSDISAEQRLNIEFADGHITSRVEAVSQKGTAKPQEAKGSSPSVKKENLPSDAKKAKKTPPNQGSLF